MDSNLVFKVVGIGLLVAFSCQILSRSGRDDHAMLVSLTGIVIVLIMLVGKISELFNAIRSAFGI
jgi:stage III sporulation protein AC